MRAEEIKVYAPLKLKGELIREAIELDLSLSGYIKLILNGRKKYERIERNE